MFVAKVLNSFKLFPTFFGAFDCQGANVVRIDVGISAYEHDQVLLPLVKGISFNNLSLKIFLFLGMPPQVP